ncbi:MAG TPA: transposase [Pyrinomonadaceae bacterium]|nr:transposase [Pyrinomonadaceae bacterium]
MEANAALRAIVRRDTGEGYREMLRRLAEASGIATPTAEDLVRLDRKRKGKRLSNADWTSPSDPEARIAKLKDGRTRLADKPEHAVDLDTGAIVAAEIHPADRGDTTTLPETLQAAEANLAAVDAAPRPEDPAELVADKGYHSREGLKELEDGAWRSRIAEKKVPGVSRWHGDDEARRAVYNNRGRLRSGVAREAFELRAELCERGFALVLDRGGMHAPGLAARPREPAQALPRACRRLQPRPGHAPPGRRGHPEGVPGPGIGPPARPRDGRWRRAGHPRRRHRCRGRDARRQLRAEAAQLKPGFGNALL